MNESLIMGLKESDYYVEDMLLKYVGNDRALIRLGNMLACEKIFYLLDEVQTFHRIDQNNQLQKYFLSAGKNRKEYDKKFKEACSDQAWFNLGVVIIEALATFGISAAAKGVQAANTALKILKGFNALGDINTAFSTYADFNAASMSDKKRKFIQRKGNKGILLSGIRTVKNRVNKLIESETRMWMGALPSGISMYLYLRKKHRNKNLEDMNVDFIKLFLHQMTGAILTVGKVWQNLGENTPQPSLWEYCWTDKPLNNVILSNGFLSAYHSVLSELILVFGHRDCTFGIAEARKSLAEDRCFRYEKQFGIEFDD